MKPGETISLFPSSSSDLICEEKKVLASPTEDDFASSTSNEDYSKLSSGMNSLQGVSRDVHKHNIMLHDTPPTTPSTESLLSSSPSNETDSFPINDTESSLSGEGEPDLFYYDSNRF
ncbi:hypothetical protein CEXT_265351 [Caerostris extrusa]|uniref:Uncharacterized protein n=1 Tax=Caerostris extrusa TaxID=172846 RepID=A0AAV4V428_CAEEX|nr:hypothetical protein CEXT_265351 [Caerostris extrusa]